MKLYPNSQDATGAWVGYNDGKNNTNLLGEVNEPWSMQDYIHRINTELVLQPHCLFGFDIIGSVPSSSDVAWTFNILYSVHTSEDPLTRPVTVTLLGDDSASTPGTDSLPDPGGGDERRPDAVGREGCRGRPGACALLWPHGWHGAPARRDPRADGQGGGLERVPAGAGGSLRCGRPGGPCVLLLVVGGNLWKSNLRVKRVTVVGAVNVESNQIIQLADIPTGTPLYDVDLTRVQRNAQSHYFIRRATVERDLSGGIRITVEERTPLAVILGAPLWYVDDRGVVLPSSISKAVSSPRRSVPAAQLEHRPQPVPTQHDGRLRARHRGRGL